MRMVDFGIDQHEMQKGFEVEFEKILTEKGGTVKGALATNSISNTGDIYTTGTFVAGNTAGEARLQLAGTNRYFYLNSGSWGVWTENGSEPLSKLCGVQAEQMGQPKSLLHLDKFLSLAQLQAHSLMMAPQTHRVF